MDLPLQPCLACSKARCCVQTNREKDKVLKVILWVFVCAG